MMFMMMIQRIVSDFFFLSFNNFFNLKSIYFACQRHKKKNKKKSNKCRQCCSTSSRGIQHEQHTSGQTHKRTDRWRGLEFHFHKEHYETKAPTEIFLRLRRQAGVYLYLWMWHATSCCCFSCIITIILSSFHFTSISFIFFFFTLFSTLCYEDIVICCWMLLLFLLLLSFGLFDYVDIIV